MVGEPQRLYHFLPDDFVDQNIAHRHLKLSFADAVNDLFEMRPFDFGDNETGRKLREAWDEQIIKHSMSQGFISFSSIWSPPTMWAHYANNHAGCCLGFDVSGKKGDQPFFNKIKYLEFLSRVDMRLTTDDAYAKDMAKYASNTKSKHWEYEQEWRVWVTLDKAEVELKTRFPRRYYT